MPLESSLSLQTLHLASQSLAVCTMQPTDDSYVIRRRNRDDVDGDDQKFDLKIDYWQRFNPLIYLTTGGVATSQQELTPRNST